MNWTRSETLGLAAPDCAFCFGRGTRPGRSNPSPCQCVLRHIFRVCYARFLHCLDKEKHLSQVSLTKVQGSTRGLSFGRKDEEYVADFLLVAKRHLDPADLKVFKAHFLLGADWKLCCDRLKVDRGSFFHQVYRIMHRLGRVFRELKPYPLFPLEDYYDTHVAIDVPAILPLPRELKPRPLVPPVRQAA